YVAGKKDPAEIKYAHPLLKEIASDTYGILVYQEQVMQAARTVAGYTLGGADELRRAMGKKDANEMKRHSGIFVAGAAKTHGIDEKTAKEIFAVLEKFAEYGFNKSHSAAYAFLSYRTAYLKANYPVEFMAATLGVESGNAEKVAFFVEECANIGVNVLGPDINQSNANFTPIPNELAAPGGAPATAAGTAAATPGTTLPASPGCIRYGIGSIKGVGEIAAKAIIEERTQNGNYKDLVDFLQRLTAVSAVNSRVIENLIKTGAFDYSGDDRRHLLDSADSLKKSAESDKADRASGQTNLFDMFDLGGGGTGGGADRILRKAPLMPSAEKLQYEKELLGFYLSGHPMNAYAGLERAINTLDSGPLELAAAKYSKDVRHAIRLCGVASGIQKKITKGDSTKNTPPRPWAFFTLSTKKDNYSINLFPEAYSEFAAEVYKDKLLLDENQHLLVDAELAYRADRGEWSIHAHRIAPLAERIPYLVRSVLFLLYPVGEADDFLEKMADVLQETSGRTVVHVGFLQPDGRVLRADLPTTLKAYCGPDFYRAFIRHPACAGAVVDIPPPAERERKWPKKR
ncbi:MAG: DNA polymerase III subunit alpha, partial [Puniceicoccales bacterium]|nr:DNA polymerase III subunit alpha [Puniceicoccales bacterium]